MKKIILILVCVAGFSTSALAAKKYILSQDAKIPYLNTKEFNKLTKKQKRTYYKILKKSIVSLAEKPNQKFSWSIQFFKQAYAQSQSSYCIDYAGWPRTRTADGNCPAPDKGSCVSNNTVQCAPIFGRSICVGPSNGIENCEKSDLGIFADSYIQNLVSQRDQMLKDYMNGIENVCRAGVEASTCERLYTRIRRATGEQGLPDPVPSAVASVPAGTAIEDSIPIAIETRQPEFEEAIEASQEVVPAQSSPKVSEVAVKPSAVAEKPAVVVERPKAVAASNGPRKKSAEKCSTSVITTPFRFQSGQAKEPFISVARVKDLFCSRKKMTTEQTAELRALVKRQAQRLPAADKKHHMDSGLTAAVEACIRENQKGEFPSSGNSVSISCQAGRPGLRVCTLQGRPRYNQFPWQKITTSESEMGLIMDGNGWEWCEVSNYPVAAASAAGVPQQNPSGSAGNQ